MLIKRYKVDKSTFYFIQTHKLLTFEELIIKRSLPWRQNIDTKHLQCSIVWAKKSRAA